MRIAVVVQLDRIPTGGGEILRLLNTQMAAKHDISLISLVDPSRLKPAVKTGLKYILYAMGNNQKSVAVVTPKYAVRNFDLIICSWVEDCYQLVQLEDSSHKIMHFCQSMETWSGLYEQSLAVYSNSIVRRYTVAKWMIELLPHGAEYLGVFLPEEFLSLHNEDVSIERNYILFVQHPGWWKNSINNYIFSVLLRNYKNLDVYQVGGSELKEVSKHQNFIPRRDLFKLFKKSEYYVSLSLYEGCPLNILEALSAGCKVVASDIPAHREIYNNVNGKNMILLDSFTPVNVRSAIRQLENISIVTQYEMQQMLKIHYSCENFQKKVNNIIENWNDD